MAGDYGFSFNLKMLPKDTKDLIKRTRQYLEDNDSNESEILKEVLSEEKEDLIVFNGENEDAWRYSYANEVLSLISKIENDFGGKFKGEFIWYEYEMEEDTIEKWVFDGEGNTAYDVETVPNPDLEEERLAEVERLENKMINDAIIAGLITLSHINYSEASPKDASHELRDSIIKVSGPEIFKKHNLWDKMFEMYDNTPDDWSGILEIVKKKANELSLDKLETILLGFQKINDINLGGDWGDKEKLPKIIQTIIEEKRLSKFGCKTLTIDEILKALYNNNLWEDYSFNLINNPQEKLAHKLFESVIKIEINSSLAELCREDLRGGSITNSENKHFLEIALKDFLAESNWRDIFICHFDIDSLLSMLQYQHSMLKTADSQLMVNWINLCLFNLSFSLHKVESLEFKGKKFSILDFLYLNNKLNYDMDLTDDGSAYNSCYLNISLSNNDNGTGSWKEFKKNMSKYYYNGSELILNYEKLSDLNLEWIDSRYFFDLKPWVRDFVNVHKNYKKYLDVFNDVFQDFRELPVNPCMDQWYEDEYTWSNRSVPITNLVDILFEYDKNKAQEVITEALNVKLDFEPGSGDIGSMAFYFNIASFAAEKALLDISVKSLEKGFNCIWEDYREGYDNGGLYSPEEGALRRLEKHIMDWTVGTNINQTIKIDAENGNLIEWSGCPAPKLDHENKVILWALVKPVLREVYLEWEDELWGEDDVWDKQLLENVERDFANETEWIEKLKEKTKGAS